MPLKRIGNLQKCILKIIGTLKKASKKDRKTFKLHLKSIGTLKKPEKKSKKGQ